MLWLLDEDVMRELEHVLRSGSFNPTAEQLQAFVKQREDAAAADMPRNMLISAGSQECVIVVEGVLVKRPSLLMYYYGYGGCTYNDIQVALAPAEANPDIKRIVLRVDSPGGECDGMFDTIAAIEACTKPITAKVAKAQSAAYGIAAATRRIEAQGPGSRIGSIGVAAQYMIWPEEVTVTNTASPNKRPDPRTDEGRKAITEELDAINELFVECIARGRSAASGKKVSPKEVMTAYGKGSTLMATAARKLGMIDLVVGNPKLRSVSRTAEGAPEPEALQPENDPAGDPAGDEPTNPAAANGGENEDEMDLKKLMAEHPAVYEAAVKEARETARAEGVTAGVAQERKRCSAHLKMAKTTGASDVAHKAIESGASVMDEDVHAEYMSAAINRSAQTARQTETETAEAATAGAPAVNAGAAGKPAKDLGDQVVAALENRIDL